MKDQEAELDADEMEEGFALPPESALGVARWLRWTAPVFAPLLAALMGWGCWEIVQDRLAGRGWESLWLLVFMLATLGGLALLFLAALALILRARLTLSHQGMALRGVFGTRTIPWHGIEGYRWRDGQVFIYPASDRWPMNLSHFENQGLLHAWLYCHLPDLHAAELAQEAREIGDDHELGLTGEEKAAKLAGLRRVVRAVNWIGYVAAVLGGLNALFLEHGEVQLVAASVLIGVPVALVILALRYRNQVRLDYKEGSRYPEALTGILASSLALGLISLLDPHTLIGERFYHWTVPIAAGSAALWLSLEWERILAQRRRLLIALHIASVVFLSSFWAGGSVYQVNKNSDVSAPAWDTTRVTRLRESKERTGTAYYAEVAPWSASPGPVELKVSRATYDTLHAGAAVDISVRRGALEIPWVDEVRLKARAN